MKLRSMQTSLIKSEGRALKSVPTPNYGIDAVVERPQIQLEMLN